MWTDERKMWLIKEFRQNLNHLVGFCIPASAQDKPERKRVWACESESKGGAEKREAPEIFF